MRISLILMMMILTVIAQAKSEVSVSKYGLYQFTWTETEHGLNVSTGGSTPVTLDGKSVVFSSEKSIFIPNQNLDDLIQNSEFAARLQFSLMDAPFPFRHMKEELQDAFLESLRRK